MKTPHKHAEVIKAWADGNTVQLYTGGGWADVNRPGWDDDMQYRIKPEPRKGWYRVALMKPRCGRAFCGVVGSEAAERSYEEQSIFCRWLTERIEYEVD